MKIIVLICMLCTTNIIFGQTPWTTKRYDSNQYEKKGEFRENRYGGVDYYKYKQNNNSMYDVTAAVVANQNFNEAVSNALDRRKQDFTKSLEFFDKGTNEYKKQNYAEAG